MKPGLEKLSVGTEEQWSGGDKGECDGIKKHECVGISGCMSKELYSI